MRTTTATKNIHNPKTTKPFIIQFVFLLSIWISLFCETTTAFALPSLLVGNDSRTTKSKTMSSNNNNSNEETTTTTTPQTQQQQDPKSTYEVQTWNPLRLLVLRLGFTEPAWTSPLNYGKKDGTYKCAYCGNTLFDTDAKYDSGRYEERRLGIFQKVFPVLYCNHKLTD